MLPAAFGDWLPSQIRTRINSAVTLMSANADHPAGFMAERPDQHLHIGDGKNARLCYERCLKQFPDIGIAQAALRLMNAERNSGME